MIVGCWPEKQALLCSPVVGVIGCSCIVPEKRNGCEGEKEELEIEVTAACKKLIWFPIAGIKQRHSYSAAGSEDSSVGKLCLLVRRGGWMFPLGRLSECLPCLY